MHKFILTLVLGILTTTLAIAQQVNVHPTVSAASGTYDDEVSVTCTFPEGCAGGKYWINGGEIQAKAYDAPILIDYDCKLSVAGTDATGRIITDVVSRDYKINRVTPPSIVVTPAEGNRTTSFYVTRIDWKHVGLVELDLDPFKEGGARHGEHVVWLIGPDGKLISGGDTNNLWASGLNSFKAYIYKNYQQTAIGDYTLHIASGVFVIDGKHYDQETVLHYTISDGNAAPIFSPASGEYKGSVTVTIDYPTDETAFYKFYKLNGGKAKQYTAPFTLTETTTVEAYGMDEDFTAPTPSAFATYTITAAEPTPEVLATPSISLLPSEGGKTVVITSHAEGEGQTIKYWMNHRMTTAQLYTGPFTADHNCTISAVCYNDHATSQAASVSISDMPADRGDLGELTLLTPVTNETAHLSALSPNGRWAVGYMGSDTSSKGFIWDIEANRMSYASTIYINQLWAIADDGTAYGWRSRETEIDESMNEDDLLFGAFKNGTWTEMSREAYDALVGTPTIGTISIPGVPTEVTAISPNGQWAILGQTHRYNVLTGEAEYLTSMSERYSGNNRPEVLTAITDDGTIFGTYDASYISPDNGVALVCTTDGRWRTFTDWLRDLPYSSAASLGLADIDLAALDKYTFSSVRGASSAEGLTLLLHATTKGISSEDTFTRGLALRLNVQTHHLAPAGLEATQMSGRVLVKLTWDAPINDAALVKGYTILRDGETITELPADVFAYYDESVEGNILYTYTIKALYADGKMSAPSREVTVRCDTEDHLPVRNLAARRVGLNDLALSWDAPIVALPKLQYFDEDSETMPFGTAELDAEFGIRIPFADMATLKGHKIRTFQFIPTGPQKSYTLNLYRGATGAEIDYDDEPFYSQVIDPATINFGTVNTIELTTPQELPTDADLYVGLFIESNGNNNMLGTSYEGFRSGYTDLCRIDGIHNKMVAISQNSSVATDIVLPIGLGVASDDSYNGSIVVRYIVADNGKEAATTQGTRVRLEQLSEGPHDFSVTAVYRDDIASKPANLLLTITDNPKAYIGVTPAASVQDDASALLSWTAPRDEDRTLIHWGDLTPKKGWPLAKGLQGFMAISAYTVDMTAPYAEDYAITEVFFCPTAKDVEYEVALTDVDGNMLGYVAPTDLKIGEINYITLPEPVVIDPSTLYQVVVNVPECETGTAALAYDSSNKWTNGYSNLLNYGNGLTTLSEFVQVTQHPNWLMGMVVKQVNARSLPVEGYYVHVDNTQQNATALTTTQYATAPLSEGQHTASVDVIYSSGRRVNGSPIRFTVGNEGIISIESTQATTSVVSYDLQGRRLSSSQTRLSSSQTENSSSPAGNSSSPAGNSSSPAIIISNTKKQLHK